MAKKLSAEEKNALIRKMGGRPATGTPSPKHQEATQRLNKKTTAFVKAVDSAHEATRKSKRRFSAEAQTDQKRLLKAMQKATGTKGTSVTIPFANNDVPEFLKRLREMQKKISQSKLRVQSDTASV